MNIEKWIEENEYRKQFAHQVICTDDLRELLKTHAIVPRTISADLMEVMKQEKPLSPTAVLKILIDEADKKETCPYCELELCSKCGNCHFMLCPEKTGETDAS